MILPRRADKMSVRDVITDALAQVRISHPCTYQIRGGQILIVPAYVPTQSARESTRSNWTQTERIRQSFKPAPSRNRSMVRS